MYTVRRMFDHVPELATKQHEEPKILKGTLNPYSRIEKKRDQPKQAEPETHSNRGLHLDDLVHCLGVGEPRVFSSGISIVVQGPFVCIHLSIHESAALVSVYRWSIIVFIAVVFVNTMTIVLTIIVLVAVVATGIAIVIVIAIAIVL